ncbi:polymorphic toxin-type HINT domain-containing protein [Paenibacillus sp. Leaf72]|uniref:polymorphic toxin-type HINT domain-containing protein n=1 Tax=Paenibacillus sp. Leaf72 TaxID=1736234 RepID=UPI001F362E80|nr:polymorphic toxin-type HINT domain-containing protein [Paenibacillus sp. Leaf72]
MLLLFNHPFYVEGKGWTFVKDLKVGDLLVQSDGNTLKIDRIVLEHRQATVFNMTVDEFHTYFVSDFGIWVHNTGGGTCEFVKTASYTLIDGMKMKTNDVLSAAEEFLEKGYKDLGNGRLMSEDGIRVVRMGDTDILGKHGGGPHMNFETLALNPSKPRKMMVVQNLHIYLEE